MEQLNRNGFEVTGYFYNPNIQPKSEYEKRLLEAGAYLAGLGIVLIPGDYDLEHWNTETEGLEQEPEGGSRCAICYELRLKKTAEIAEKNDFEYFTTTLSISPYKNAQKLNEIGKKISEGMKVKYLESNFKKRDGYKKSIEKSKVAGLYRQDYCGCEHSKRERAEPSCDTSEGGT
jgi:predicted adenine nucleotide alpha hydrolase (AANH) superfamily ATPase